MILMMMIVSTLIMIGYALYKLRNVEDNVEKYSIIVAAYSSTMMIFVILYLNVLSKHLYTLSAIYGLILIVTFYVLKVYRPNKNYWFQYSIFTIELIGIMMIIVLPFTLLVMNVGFLSPVVIVLLSILVSVALYIVTNYISFDIGDSIVAISWVLIIASMFVVNVLAVNQEQKEAYEYQSVLMKNVEIETVVNLDDFSSNNIHRCKDFQVNNLLYITCIEENQNKNYMGIYRTDLKEGKTELLQRFELERYGEIYDITSIVEMNDRLYIAYDYGRLDMVLSGEKVELLPASNTDGYLLFRNQKLYYLGAQTYEIQNGIMSGSSLGMWSNENNDPFLVVDNTLYYRKDYSIYQEDGTLFAECKSSFFTACVRNELMFKNTDITKIGGFPIDGYNGGYFYLGFSNTSALLNRGYSDSFHLYQDDIYMLYEDKLEKIEINNMIFSPVAFYTFTNYIVVFLILGFGKRMDYNTIEHIYNKTDES